MTILTASDLAVEQEGHPQRRAGRDRRLHRVG
jgi:hypothetical protein